MKKRFFLFWILLSLKISAQIFSGSLYMKDQSVIFLNHIFVTNLSTHKTVLSNYNGKFQIDAQVGDIIRFTSSSTERKDIKITAERLSNPNLIELSLGYIIIPEVTIKNFKASGNLRKDAIVLNKQFEKKKQVNDAIGLPQPKPQEGAMAVPPVALNNGLAFNLNSIYDVFSGEQKKKERLYEYEKMNRNLFILKNYLGDEYFVSLKLPKNLVDNFLQFVYTSDNLLPYFERNNLEGIKTSIEKYNPIYQKRLRNSKLMNLSGS